MALTGSMALLCHHNKLLPAAHGAVPGSSPGHRVRVCWGSPALPLQPGQRGSSPVLVVDVVPKARRVDDCQLHANPLLLNLWKRGKLLCDGCSGQAHHPKISCRAGACSQGRNVPSQLLRGKNQLSKGIQPLSTLKCHPHSHLIGPFQHNYSMVMNK